MDEDILVEDTKLGNIAEQLGIPNANLGGPGMTTIGISGMASFGDGNGSLQKVNNLYEIDQALSWVHGKHEIKFGFNWMTTTFAFFTPPKPVGSVKTLSGHAPASAQPLRGARFTVFAVSIQ